MTLQKVIRIIQSFTLTVLWGFNFKYFSLIMHNEISVEFLTGNYLAENSLKDQ